MTPSVEVRAATAEPSAAAADLLVIPVYQDELSGVGADYPALAELTNEAEADLFGLNAAQEPDGFAEVALKLSEYRKLSPGPVEEWIFYDHPSGRNRILMAMRWKAENPPTAASSAP